MLYPSELRAPPKRLTKKVVVWKSFSCLAVQLAIGAVFGNVNSDLAMKGESGIEALGS